MVKKSYKTEGGKYLFGPVPSRRLGLSLGVDIVPFKVCSLDCVYCQLGQTTEKTTVCKEYVPIEAVLAELKDKAAQGIKADFITLSGSGEPTLNSHLGELIKGIKKITDIPVAILTNGTLLYKQKVRAGCAKADLVVPSLDAGDEQTFRKINRPHRNISIEKLIAGMCAFRKEFAGQLVLEVFLVEGLNTGIEQIEKIKKAIERIQPDRIQLNNAVRPTTVQDIRAVGTDKLRAIADQLGTKCEIIPDFSPARHGRGHKSKAENLLSALKRRPCSLNDICSALNMHRNEALKYIAHFQKQQLIESEEKNGIIFFRATP